MFKHLQTKQDGILVYFDYKKLRFKLLYIWLISLLMGAIIVTLFPPLWLFISSFKEAEELYRIPFSLFPDKIDLGKIVDVWKFQDLSLNYFNSLIVVLGSVVAAILFNGLLAYAVSVLKPKGYKLVYGMVLASLMIPPILNMGPLYQNIVKLNLINSFIPLWLVFGASPFFFVMFKTYFDHLPRELVEAAMIDGANKIQVFTKIILPLSKPIMGVISIFTVNAAWSDFLLPYLLLLDPKKHTVMLKIYKMQLDVGRSPLFGPDELLMVLAISIIPPIILFIIFQKQITSNVATTGLKE